MDILYTQLIAGKQKAVAGFVVAFIFTQLAQHGINLDALVNKDIVDNIVFALLTYIGVYLKRNRD